MIMGRAAHRETNHAGGRQEHHALLITLYVRHTASHSVPVRVRQKEGERERKGHTKEARERGRESERMHHPGGHPDIGRKSAADMHAPTLGDGKLN